VPSADYLQNLDSAFHEIEEEHYWYTARRDAIIRLLTRAGFSMTKRASRCVEVGCGTGGMLSILSLFAESVEGVEPYEAAVRTARQRHLAFEVHHQDGIEFLHERLGQFDLIASFDVLEHIEDHEKMIEAMYGALAPGGCLVVTVPAHRMLWSSFDDFDHHYRRYSKAELSGVLGRAGFVVKRATYFYMSLFPAVFAVRKIRTLAGLPPIAQNRDVMVLPPRWVNWFIKKLLALEVLLIRYANLPFGSSLCCVARKEIA
jgi:2-polyprenyl-3-methyl-5-hydroxy-6-metoxy-1,4-benzoquinol methylase